MDHPDGILDMLMLGDGDVAQRSVETFVAWIARVHGRLGHLGWLELPLLEDGRAAGNPSFIAVTGSQLPTPLRHIRALSHQWFEDHPEQLPWTVAVHYPDAGSGRVLVQAAETQR